MLENLVSDHLKADARVRGFRLEQGETLVARVTPAQEWEKAEREAAYAAISSRMMRQWQMVFDRTYRGDEAVRAPSFSGWVSSFTGAPMSQAAMQAWLDDAVAQLRAVPHARVLDIGCGVGLVVAALGPACAAYHAIDQSEEAVAALGAWLATQPALAHVRLAQRAAHELDDLPAGSIDLVVLNSVVQYFPDLDYFRRVLRAAAERLVPGGHIFLGDLRAVNLLPVHAAAVATAQAPAGATPAEVRERQQAVLALGREFAVDGGLFAELPGLSDVRFSLKPVAADPELAGYRFDAMLTFNGGDPGRAAPAVMWDGELGGLLTQDAVAVLGVPNARLAAHVALARSLDGVPGDGAADGEWPEALVEAAAARGYMAELRFTAGSAAGRFDVLLRRVGSPQVSWPVGAVGAPLANDPLGAELAATLRRTLQQSIDQAVPGPGRVKVVLESGARADFKWL